MKIKLPVIALMLVLFFAGCKKEKEEDEFNPFTDVPNIYYTNDVSITLDSQDRIVDYSVSTFPHYQSGEVSCHITYGDSTVTKIIEQPYPPMYDNKQQTIYYLNNLGHADSAQITTTYYFVPHITVQKQYYTYSTDGYLQNISDTLGEQPYVVFTYNNGNYGLPGEYEYYSDLAKVDIFSFGRNFDGLVTGSDDVNLPKKIHNATYNKDTYYYYQFNNDGYVTACIIMNINLASGDSTFIKTTYHY